jgi:hypothetical protein
MGQSMNTILWLNELLNRRAPAAKTVIRTLLPSILRTKFAQKKFDLTIQDESYTNTFINIHSKNWWGSKESVSGYGSQLSRTVTIRRELSAWIKATGIRSIFDAPCGDYNWMNEVIRASDVKYIGADIVKEIVRINNSKFAISGKVSFVVLDILRDPLPQTDAWVCRDVLFHFPNDAITTVLDRFRQSKIRFLLTSHFNDTSIHPDIRFGGYRPVNLCQPPFNWPPPSRLIFDGDDGAGADRYLGIWENPNSGLQEESTV